MTKGTIVAIILNALVAAGAAGVDVLQSADWTQILPNSAVWIAVGLSALNALAHYWTGDRINAVSR